ncbi:response regulator [Pseudalkalibacillus caeni]|uniref:response regulator n=1 Tax=Exobacillus caeni TaxID=2574798 RepID=UPI0026BBE5DB
MKVIEVLIIEDDVRIAEINRRFTEKIAGCTVTGVATSIEEGKELLEILNPDLVLLDVYFPDGEGIELLWHIRQRNKSTDVIMITAAKEVDSIQEALRGGAIDYIIKPVIFARFQKTIENFKKHRMKLESQKTLEQEEVDQLFLRKRDKEHLSFEQNVPKGSIH